MLEAEGKPPLHVNPHQDELFISSPTSLIGFERFR